MNQLPDHIRDRQFLVTDDYASMRLLICNDLKKLGVSRIITASSGNEALSIIKKNLGTSDEIGFLLTDLMMENGTGLELTKGIRSDPGLKSLPILMISSMSDVANMIECVRAGINNYIVKPWVMEDFARKLSDCVRLKK